MAVEHEAGFPGLVNPVKQRMQAGEVSLGLSLRLVKSPDIALLARASGHDFLFIDGQHSIFDLETIVALTRAATGCGLASIVRVRSVDDPNVGLLLDNGVSGLVFPNVTSADEARRVVDATRFPPTGRRTVTGGYPHFDYRSVPLREATRALDESTLVVCMVESPEAVSCVEDIAAVDGVDVLLVGSNDLLYAMGKPGAFDDPDLADALDRTLRAATAHGKFAGVGGNRDVARQAELVRKGFRFMTTQTDIGFLTSAATRWIHDLRTAIEDGRTS